MKNIRLQLLTVLLSSGVAATVFAAPTLTVGTASGVAGTSVNLPISFDPTTASVAGIQFNLTLPAGLSTGTVTAGAILNTAGKNVNANLNGNTWTFLIFGLNQTTIASGSLMTVQLNVAPGTVVGNLSVAVSNVVYSDPNGISITAGTSTNGTVTVVNSAPTVATAALATPNPATASTTNLSVLGADDGGEPALTYTWATTGTPPAPVTFSANSSNAAKNSIATFTKAGAYSFQVTIKDTGNLTVTSSVNVTVSPTLTTITISPASTSTVINGTRQFTATGFDQFGTALAAQPIISWTVSGGGSINAATGLFTAGASVGGPFTVTAASGGKSGTATVTITNSAPTIATAANATPNPTTGSTTNLSVLGTDDGGEPALTYTWATTGTPPAPVTFSANGSNAAKNSIATFTKAGAYSFQVSIKDTGNLTVTSSVNVTVNQALTTITASPSSASVQISATQTFTANALDQFNAALTVQPSFSWTVSGGGSINAATGLFSAGTTAGGPFTVTAASGGKNGTASVTVLNACDLNADGSSNSSDLQLAVNQAIQITGCTTADINKDTFCNIIDVQRVVNAVLGGQCVVTP